MGYGFQRVARITFYLSDNLYHKTCSVFLCEAFITAVTDKNNVLNKFVYEVS